MLIPFSWIIKNSSSDFRLYFLKEIVDIETDTKNIWFKFKKAQRLRRGFLSFKLTLNLLYAFTPR